MDRKILTGLKVIRHHSISELPPKKWDRLITQNESPFYEWGWLYNLEVSGSIGARVGFTPSHFTVWDDKENLVAAAPLFIKEHSYGEFVFDQALVEAAQNLGYDYYPKLIGMSPYTPAVGYKFFTLPEFPEANDLLFKAIEKFCDENNIFGIHFLYADPNWAKQAVKNGYLEWFHPSYIWKNQSFDSFESYLESLSSKRRRNIKKERDALMKNKPEFRILRGEEIKPSKLALMYKLYVSTCNKFLWWGSEYLNGDFFKNLEDFSKERIILIEALSAETEETLGMSFFVQKNDKLFGRYWGCFQEIEFLHFELCYYLPIRFCIENKIKEFDAGAGNGPHKKRRGFPAQINSSLHFFRQKAFHQIVANHFNHCNREQIAQIRAFNGS